MDPIILETMNDIINRVDAREWKRVNEHRHRIAKRYKRDKEKLKNMEDDWQVATEKIAQENSDLHHDIKCLKVRHREKIDEIHHQNLSLSKQWSELKKENKKLIKDGDENRNYWMKQAFSNDNLKNQIEKLKFQLKRAEDALDEQMEKNEDITSKLEVLEKIREQDTYSIKRLEKLNLENKCSRCSPWRG